MARRRFAAVGGAVTLHKKLAIAIVTWVAAAGLAGCASSPVPGTPEEQIYFDRAVGYEIHKIAPHVRLGGAIGYPRTDGGFYR